MSPLSEEEEATFKALQKKSKEPAAPPIAKSVSASIDFGDEKQIERAIEHGFLTRAQAEKIKEDEKDGDGDDDDEDSKKPRRKTPRRKGYFD